MAIVKAVRPAGHPFRTALLGLMALACLALGVAAGTSSLGTAVSLRLGLPGFFAPIPAGPGLPALGGTVPSQAPPTPAAAVAPVTDRPAARRILTLAAQRHGLKPNLFYAVAWWESGWDQTRISSTGAVGLMQIEPDTAAGAGPALLGRQVDIHDPADNADLGAALLRQYLLEFRDGRLALAAYYQGEGATRDHGVEPGSRSYVDGIVQLFLWLEAGHELPV
jgi:hypothetical protein